MASMWCIWVLLFMYNVVGRIGLYSVKRTDHDREREDPKTRVRARSLGDEYDNTNEQQRRRNDNALESILCKCVYRNPC